MPSMRDTSLCAQILGFRSPWKVVHVDLDRPSSNVVVHVAAAADAAFTCTTYDQPATGYARRQWRWRHLDTCQYTTILQAQVPRVTCPVHGVVTVPVPWAEPGSSFTQLFAAVVIAWLNEASIQAVSRQVRVSWSGIDRIMARAVARGMARRDRLQPTRLCVDKVRRQEHRQLSAEGMDVLKGSKYAWLTNVENMTAAQRQRFITLRDSALKTARAWAIKDLAIGLWHYRSRTWAMKAWKRWLGWAMRCRLAPIKAAAITIATCGACSMPSSWTCTTAMPKA